MIFNNSKLYDVLKWVALVALDALGIAYESLSAVWGFPFGDEIMKTCTIVSLLIGTLIGVSSYKYNKLPTEELEEDKELLEERDDE